MTRCARYDRPKDWEPPPLLQPWQQRILRIVAGCPGLTTQQIGDRYYRCIDKAPRHHVALYELRILAQRGFVQRHRNAWSPTLLAAMALGAQE